MTEHSAPWHFAQALLISWLPVFVAWSTVLAQRPDASASHQEPMRVPRQQEQITSAPDYSSAAPSIKIVSVELTQGDSVPLVRVKLRNRVDEAVMGYQFEIHGSDPNTWVGHGTLASFLATPRREVIKPLAEHTVEIPRSNFEAGDSLRLAAVLFASGRGEGDAAKVNEMRKEASILETPLP